MILTDNSNGCKITSLVNFDFLPDSLEVVGSLAFAECVSLEKIEIPKNVSKIGVNAFYQCQGLKEISLLSVEPPSVFEISFDEETYKTATLKVPAESKEAYENNVVGGKFNHIISDIEESENGINSISSDNNNLWDVYDTRGLLLKRGYSKEYEDNLKSGMYILKQGEKSVKWIVP